MGVVATHKVIRATQDVDLLVDGVHADALDAQLLAPGYRCVYRSEDASNYLRGDERVEPIADWFTTLDDLMAVVEALCPTWPHRESFGPMPDLRL